MWKIFINYGYRSEFDKLKDLSFKTKKDAQVWAKENGYPYKCIMCETDYCEKMNNTELHILNSLK